MGWLKDGRASQQDHGVGSFMSRAGIKGTLKRGIRTYRIDSVATFHSIVATLSSDWVFRGHADTSWLLQPSLARHISLSRSPNPTERNSFEQAVRQHAAEYSESTNRLQYGKHLDAMNEVELMIYGQHHGLKTPYLDWTQSPYVALFFAACECFENDGLIWALNRKSCPKFLKSQDYELTVLESVHRENQRQVAQLGLLTHLTGGGCLMSAVENNAPDDKAYMYKISFRSNLKADFLKTLEMMNLGFHSLMPDIFGVAASANLKTLLRMRPTENE
jgi:hypothetical protein